MDEADAAAEPEQRAIPKRFRPGPFAYPDFRILWTGSFLSFLGSWIQNVAQGWMVQEMTGNTALLAWVSFAGMAPVSIFGPFAGSLSDMFNKRVVLILTQAVFACGALFLAAATYYGFVQYWHVLMVAVISGTAGAIEMPTRQSVVSKVVPPSELARAIPVNAMTFNLARLIGPALGGFLYSAAGPSLCYSINGFSYLALIAAALAIRADLRPAVREPQPIKDLLFEGLLYTWRDKRLRTLFILESIVSAFGLIYLPLMPAIAHNMGLDARGLGFAMTSVGVGALTGLGLMTFLSHRPLRALIIRLAMTSMGLALTAVSFVHSPWLAFPLFGLMGMSAIMQFNTTNTLFQLLSPEHLRGRVLAMHIWALAGVGPFGTLAAGFVAQEISIEIALMSGGLIVLIGATWGWVHRNGLVGVE
jgi:MFS family permease